MPKRSWHTVEKIMQRLRKAGMFKWICIRLAHRPQKGQRSCLLSGKPRNPSRALWLLFSMILYESEIIGGIATFKWGCVSPMGMLRCQGGRGDAWHLIIKNRDMVTVRDSGAKVVSKIVWLADIWCSLVDHGISRNKIDRKSSPKWKTCMYNEQKYDLNHQKSHALSINVQPWDSLQIQSIPSEKESPGILEEKPCNTKNVYC